MRTNKPATFPVDAMELRRFMALTGLSDAAFDSLRPDLTVWRFSSREFVGEREALRAIGRKAVVRIQPATDRSGVSAT